MVHPQQMRTVALLAQIALVAFVLVTVVLVVFLVILCCFNVISTFRRKQELRQVQGHHSAYVTHPVDTKTKVAF